MDSDSESESHGAPSAPPAASAATSGGGSGGPSAVPEPELDLDWAAPLTGNTAMHVAAQHGWSEMVALLAWYGADVSARNADGDTPKQVAIKHVSKYSEAVEVLS